MIPKIIHFCWYGKGEYNETIKKCIASWEEKLPDYTIKRWDETNTPFDKLPFLRLLYKQKKWSFITDYIRLYAIYKEGGVYMDTDIEILKRFDELHKEEAFTGFQTDMISSPFPVAAGFIGAKKGNTFVKIGGPPIPLNFKRCFFSVSLIQSNIKELPFFAPIIPAATGKGEEIISV